MSALCCSHGLQEITQSDALPFMPCVICVIRGIVWTEEEILIRRIEFLQDKNGYILVSHYPFLALQQRGCELNI